MPRWTRGKVAGGEKPPEAPVVVPPPLGDDEAPGVGASKAKAKAKVKATDSE